MSDRRAWRPSNGTEGSMFEANRCSKCVNDRYDWQTGDGQTCVIWMNALVGIDDPHLYWDAEAGHGECDMFQPRADAEAAARADERVSAELHDYHMPAWTAGYRQAIADCIAAVEALPHDGYCVATDPNYVRLCECLRADALAALRALGGSDE